MNYLFKRDSIVATLSVFVVLGIIVFNPFNDEIFNPLKISLTDFAITDLAFSEAHVKKGYDDRIVIINIDTAKRKTIAEIIERVEKYHPAVLGLDVLFPPKADPGNSALSAAMLRHPDIIFSRQAHYDDSSKKYYFSPAQFSGNSSPWGYVNFIAKKGEVVRYYPPFLSKDKDSFAAFSTALIKRANPAAYATLCQRNNDQEWINYQRTDSGYYCIHFTELFNNNIDSSFLKNKIVLVGLVVASPYDIDDKHFTPMNKKIIGRSVPDMNGIIIHANIISMILDGDYIHSAPGWLLIFIAIFLTWIHMAYLIKYFISRHLWFHLLVKITELASGILLFYGSVLLLRNFRIHLDFTLTLIAVIISVDILYFYEALAIWLARKFSYRSVFAGKKNH